MKPLLVTIFCGAAVDRVRAMFPHCDVLSFDGTRADRAAVVRAIKGRALWVLVGYSAGCHGVRDLLDLEPPIVVTIDGTHASLPGRPQTMPVGPWRRLFELAQAGQRLWVATHTFNTYTEHLEPGPYRSTVGTLRDVTSALLPMPEAGHSPLVLRMPALVASDGAMFAGTVIASYRSTSCDRAAHAAQVWAPDGTSGLEYALREFVGPVLGSAEPPGPGLARQMIDAVAGALRAIAAVPRMSTLTFAEALVSAAQLSLAEGVREASHNAGKTINAWLAAVGASSPNNWCAASVSHWLDEAERRSGLKRPVKGSAGAKATMAQFQAAGRWLDVAEARRRPELVRPGLVPVWHRGKPGDWTGHTGVTETAARADGTFNTIEGNSGPTASEVARMVRRLDDPLLLGFGLT